MYPMTASVSKQLLPVYDKPMIHYPLSTLMSADIRKILIISQSDNLPLYRRLYGNGNRLGIDISYAKQDEPKGLAQAFTIANDAKFLRGAVSVGLILGDNIFHGHGLEQAVIEAACSREPTIFCAEVSHPERYGVATFDPSGNLASIQEKPFKPPSNTAVTGLYFYPKDVTYVVEKLNSSERGELEITDVNMHYLKAGRLRAIRLPRGVAWLDTGSPDTLLQASHYVQTIQERQGQMVGCPEEIAFNKGWIGTKDIADLYDLYSNEYVEYLMHVCKKKK